MNCSQARALLAVFRELNNEDRQSLEHHLATCAACNDASAHTLFIGERIRSVPQIEPSPDAHDKLMHALAAEHVRYLQKTPAASPSTPTPAFLTPYLKELARKTPHVHSLAALSTADTGPLPVIQPGRRQVRRRPQMHHFAIVGIAASFLIVIMTTGLLSLLYLTSLNQQNTLIPRGGNAQVAVQAVGQAAIEQLKLSADYPNIASATINNGTIYYSAYNQDSSSWTLDKFSQDVALRATATGEPLVTTMDGHQIVVLGSNNDWLFWLQMTTPPKTPTTNKGQSHQSNATHNVSNANNTAISGTQPTSTTKTGVNKLTGNWNLEALYIGNNPSATANQSTQSTTTTNKATGANKALQATSNKLSQPITLHSDLFNAAVEPDWVTSPIQGISFYQDSAVVAYMDSKGTSYLSQYSFDAKDPSQPVQSTVLASANGGHVLTSPTNTENGNSIYWSDEWYTQDNGLNSQIWTRQMSAAQPDNTSGRFTPHLQAQTYQYSTDTNSFSPQIVNNTLFLLSKDPTTKILLPAQTGPATTTTPQAQATQPSQQSAQNTPTTTGSTPTPTATQQNITQLLGNPLSVDPTVRTPQIDENITGKLQAFIVNSYVQASTIIADNKVVTGIHGGASYLIWQDPDGQYEMYDARNNVMVNGINDVDRSAIFVSVSGNSVIWTSAATNDQSGQANDANAQITFNVLRWPK
ncbi:zf-HC2 domain-containing protein [Ktedonobacteria bacterium brp13]|nr:zf-HC2 domain-containing protein [Ktedonobacteria bacterium brp13]